MEPETIALVSALVVLVTAVVGLVAKVRKEVQEVHVMVDGRMTEALNRIIQLDEALKAAGIQSPERPPHGD